MRFEGLRVLLVDVDDGSRRHVTAILHQVGIESCGEADDGLAGLERLRVEHPDLLMVGRVPDCGDGIAFVRQVREEVSDSLPIILIAEYSDLWRLGEARQAGATEFLVRPFTARALVQRIQRAVAFSRKAVLRVV